ncbi:MAG: OsmC family protein [Calditrichaeota bacterium]|nr:OsmC family protein [Calditrichota bacterium]
MPVRYGNAVWRGDLKSGSGVVSLHHGAWSGAYSFASRFEEGAGTNPEEMIASAHAACFSMAFANALAQSGFTPKSVETTAQVHLTMVDGKPTLTPIDLICTAEVPGIDEAKFQEFANDAKVGCPVSRALASAEIRLEATLKSA